MVGNFFWRIEGGRKKQEVVEAFAILIYQQFKNPFGHTRMGQAFLDVPKGGKIGHLFGVGEAIEMLEGKPIVELIFQSGNGKTLQVLEQEHLGLDGRAFGDLPPLCLPENKSKPMLLRPLQSQRSFARRPIPSFGVTRTMYSSAKAQVLNLYQTNQT